MVVNCCGHVFDSKAPASTSFNSVFSYFEETETFQGAPNLDVSSIVINSKRVHLHAEGAVAGAPVYAMEPRSSEASFFRTLQQRDLPRRGNAGRRPINCCRVGAHAVVAGKRYNLALVGYRTGAEA